MLLLPIMNSIVIAGDKPTYLKDSIPERGKNGRSENRKGIITHVPPHDTLIECYSED